jgi:hypothetical protein
MLSLIFFMPCYAALNDKKENETCDVSMKRAIMKTSEEVKGTSLIKG